MSIFLDNMTDIFLIDKLTLANRMVHLRYQSNKRFIAKYSNSSRTFEFEISSYVENGQSEASLWF